MNIIAIIPARGGSKRLKNKNIYPLNGKPLIAYTIEACLSSEYIKDVYVSSDSREILEVGQQFGAQGLERTESYADDATPKIVAIRHVVDELSKNEIKPDYIIIPQANSPQISTKMIDKGFKFMFDNNLWEVMSADDNGVQNAAFRIIKMPHLYNEFLSAHCGFIIANCLDVHTIEDINKLEGLV
jgi:CMP-N,N'-diacetyllegionaminic acid synthase